MSATLIAFALGILGCQFLPEIPDGPWGWLTLGTVLLLGLLLTLRSRTPQPIRLRIFLILLAFSAGASYTCWRSSQLLSDTLPEAAMGRNIRITGVVDSLPDRTARGQRFQFLVEHVGSPFHVPERLQLSVWHTQQDTETAPDQSLREVKAPLLEGLYPSYADPATLVDLGDAWLASHADADNALQRIVRGNVESSHRTLKVRDFNASL